MLEGINKAEAHKKHGNLQLGDFQDLIYSSVIQNLDELENLRKEFVEKHGQSMIENNNYDSWCELT